MTSGHYDAQSVKVPRCQKLLVQMTTSPDLAQDAFQLYPYDNSGRQKVNLPDYDTALSKYFFIARYRTFN